MLNPRAQEVENMKARVRCRDCRTTFHERIARIVHSDRIVCPTCREEMRFHGVGHIGPHETVESYIHHVEERTAHPHFSLRR